LKDSAPASLVSSTWFSRVYFGSDLIATKVVAMCSIFDPGGNRLFLILICSSTPALSVSLDFSGWASLPSFLPGIELLRVAVCSQQIDASCFSCGQARCSARSPSAFCPRAGFDFLLAKATLLLSIFSLRPALSDHLVSARFLVSGIWSARAQRFFSSSIDLWSAIRSACRAPASFPR
jgi:hypothetical protein